MTNAFTKTGENTPGTLNDNELKSVTAVIAYLAHEHDVCEATICSALTKAFKADEVKDISSDNYDDVIRFLVDFNFDEPAIANLVGMNADNRLLHDATEIDVDPLEFGDRHG